MSLIEQKHSGPVTGPFRSITDPETSEFFIDLNKSSCCSRCSEKFDGFYTDPVASVVLSQVLSGSITDPETS